jgi:signal transduction histidine kinase
MRLIISLFLLLWTVTSHTAADELQKVKVCISPDSMPIETIEDSKHIGMAADFLSLIEKRSGLELELLPTDSWSESLTFAKEHRCDVLSAAEKNDELENHFLFTESYMYFPIVIIAREGVPFVSSLESIKDKRIATIASAEYIEQLKKRYPEMQIGEMSNTVEGLKAVLSSKIDYFLDITADLTYVTRKYGISGINIVGFTGDDFHYRGAVRKDDTILFEKIQSAVQSISEEEKQVIFKKWLDTKIERVVDYTFMGKILFVVLLGFFIFYLWNRKLTQEISKRQGVEKKLHELNDSLEGKIKQQVSKMREADLILHQQSRLAQTGELLSNIAHQWRQPLARLSALFMQAEIKAKQGELDGDELQILIEQNNKIVEDMSQTIEDFTHFFQMDTRKRVWFDPVEQCRESIEIIHGTLQSNNITLHKSCPKESPTLYGHPRAFSHIILILLSNANDVLMQRKIADAEIWIEMISEKEYLTVTLEDNGGGIDEEIIEKVFDPYFTTKPKKEGTGIGLYIASTIIQRVFHGSITVSNTDKGAKFLIEISSKI